MPVSFVPRALYSLPVSSLLLGTASLPIQYIPLHSPGFKRSHGMGVDKEEIMVQDITQRMEVELKSNGFSIGKDGLVQWERQNVSHPRNWSLGKKAFNSGVVIFLDFFTTAISTAGTSAADAAGPQFGINSTLAIFSFTSIYLIGQGTGGVAFPPFSEAFGRKTLYIVSTILYALCCALVAYVPSLPAVICGRFLAGFVSAVPTTVVAGSIEDIWNMEARIWMIFAWSTVADIGLVVGPIFSTYVTAYLGWQWVFYIAAIVTGFTSLITLFLNESRPSLILKRRVLSLCKKHQHTVLMTRDPDRVPSLRSFVTISLLRPLSLLFTEPIVALVTVLNSIAFGLIYLFSEALPIVYEAFGFSSTSASLAFIPIGLGVLCSFFPRIRDQKTLRKRRALGQMVEPENKLFGFKLAAPILAIALWVFAWTIPPLAGQVPWIVSMIALVPVGFASNEFDVVLAGYLADSYTIYASSAFASLVLLRSFACASFPLFARQMFDGLGNNYAASILAGVATLFVIAPVLVTRYGKSLRERSKFARVSLEVYKANRVEDDMDEANSLDGDEAGYEESIEMVGMTM
ncbi:hypothetical protein MMC25_003068 [Agyrium rufum]|nr:hypothetical protein [Agyrium rufum]